MVETYEKDQDGKLRIVSEIHFTKFPYGLTMAAILKMEAKAQESLAYAQKLKTEAENLGVL